MYLHSGRVALCYLHSRAVPDIRAYARCRLVQYAWANGDDFYPVPGGLFVSILRRRWSGELDDRTAGRADPCRLFLWNRTEDAEPGRNALRLGRVTLGS